MASPGKVEEGCAAGLAVFSESLEFPADPSILLVGRIQSLASTCGPFAEVAIIHFTRPTETARLFPQARWGSPGHSPFS